MYVNFMGFKMLIFIIFLVLFLSACTNVEKEESESELETQLLVVNGDSMSPRIVDGVEFNYIENYYLSNSIERDDVVLYEFAGNSNLIIKQVKGLPGDEFEFVGGNIYINGNMVKNSANVSYSINSEMLELYAQNYPIIPSDTYLILGDNPAGSKDSSAFGLVDKGDIVGKVLVD